MWRSCSGAGRELFHCAGFVLRSTQGEHAQLVVLPFLCSTSLSPTALGSPTSFKQTSLRAHKKLDACALCCAPLQKDFVVIASLRLLSRSAALSRAMPRSAVGRSAGTASTASSASPPPAAAPAPTAAAALRAELDRRKVPTRLPRDVLAFLLRYPSQASSSSFSTSTGAGVQGEAPSANLRFYQDRQAALPRRAKCSELQDELKGNWDELEYRHDFVQWFFPIRCVSGKSL